MTLDLVSYREKFALRFVSSFKVSFIVDFTGVFEPPIDGTYELTVYAVTTRDQNGPMYIRNNDDILCTAFITWENNYETGMCTAIVQLAVGDSVRVTGDSANPAAILSGYSGFTGHIINDGLTA